jgi:hypothetical protein
VPASEVNVPFVRNRLLEEESKRLNKKGSKGKPEVNTQVVFGTKQPGNSGNNSNYTSKHGELYQGNQGSFGTFVTTAINMDINVVSID